MTLGILVFCVMVHIMINFQKRQAFQKIEEAVEMRLGIEKENIQLVCTIVELPVLHVCTIFCSFNST